MNRTIYEMKSRAIAYHEIINEIIPWCNQVATELDFNGAEDIQMDENHVSFIAYWHGPYQSENRELFEFEYCDLYLAPKDVALKKKEKKS